MEFAFTSEQQLIADLAGQLFAEQATSERTRRAVDGVDRVLWSTFSQEAGLAALAIPEAHGGAGLCLVELAIVAEAAGRHLAALPLIASLGLVAPALVAGGSAAQCERWLPLLASGEAAGAMGEGGYLSVAAGRLSGCAPLVAHGATASLLLLVADDGLWLVERGPHVIVELQTSIDQTRPLARLRFEDAPAEPLADPSAARAAMLRWGLTTIAADALGGAEACLARTVQYAGERVQFGHPIGAFQAVKHRLADLAVAIEQARSAVYWAAAASGDSPEAMLAAHAAKAVASEAYSAAAAAMIQLHGGIGFTWEHDAHLFFKRATADRSWMGAPEQHLDAAADLILGKSA